MKTLRAALTLVPLLGAVCAQELQVLPVAPGDDPPSIGVAEGSPTCLEFSAPLSSHALQGFRGRLLSEEQRLCLQGVPEKESVLEVKVGERKWHFRLVRGEAGLYQVRLLPPKETTTPRVETPPPAPRTPPAPKETASSSPATGLASAEAAALGAALRAVISLDRARNALLLDLVLVNRSGIPLVAEDVEVRWSGRPLSSKTAQASFSSGKRGWVPPGGSAALRLEVPVGQLSPLPALLEVTWPLTAMDATLTREVVKVAFRLEWIPAVREVN